MAITSYIDFVNNYLTKNGMIGNATNLNKAPDQLKLEVDELNDTKVSYEDFNLLNLNRADKYLASQNVVNMLYNSEGKLSKVQYNNATDVDYEVLTYNIDGKLSNVAHYVGGILKGNTVLSYGNSKLISAPFNEV